MSRIKAIFQSLTVKLLPAIIIIFIGLILGKITEKAIKKVLHSIEINILAKKVIGVKILLEEAISIGIKWLIYLMAIIIALKRLEIETIMLNFLLGGIILFCIIGILLGLRDFIPNAIGGFIIHKRNAIKKGDKIKIREIEGIVTGINLVHTILETKSKETIYIPNSTLVRELFWKRK